MDVEGDWGFWMIFSRGYVEWKNKSSSNFGRGELLDCTLSENIEYSLTIVLLIFQKKKILNSWITLVVYFGHFLLSMFLM